MTKVPMTRDEALEKAAQLSIDHEHNTGFAIRDREGRRFVSHVVPPTSAEVIEFQSGQRVEILPICSAC